MTTAREVFPTVDAFDPWQPNDYTTRNIFLAVSLETPELNLS